VVFHADIMNIRIPIYPNINNTFGPSLLHGLSSIANFVSGKLSTPLGKLIMDI